MLTVETGAIVPGANSFVERAEYIAYAAEIGVVVADDDQADTELVKASRFIATQSPRLKGLLVSRDQPLPYPRAFLRIGQFTWANNEIPTLVKTLQMELALDIRAGNDPNNPGPNPNRAVRREKVDVIETEYMGTDKWVPMTRQAEWEAILDQLQSAGGLTIPSQRVL